jgi:hypothetical protein
MEEIADHPILRKRGQSRHHRQQRLSGRAGSVAAAQSLEPYQRGRAVICLRKHNRKPAALTAEQKQAIKDRISLDNRSVAL